MNDDSSLFCEITWVNIIQQFPNASNIKQFIKFDSNVYLSNFFLAVSYVFRTIHFQSNIWVTINVY